MNQRNKREKDKKLQEDARRVLSPPPTTEENQVGEENMRAATMRKLGRKKVKKDRAKAYRELFKLELNCRGK